MGENKENIAAASEASACGARGASSSSTANNANDSAIQLGTPTPRKFYALTRPVFFVGFMGAGKTTVTRKLAHKYGLASVDADIYLEQQEGMRVRKIFSDYGEEKFREAEARVLAELAQKKPLLVSCGGGVVEAKASRKILNENFVVFLKTTAAQSKARISNFRSRPLFKELSAAEALNEKRLPLYRSVANVEIDTKDKPAGVIAREVASALFRNEVLVEKCKQKQ